MRQQIADRLARCVLCFVLVCCGLLPTGPAQGIDLKVDRVTVNNQTTLSNSLTRVNFRQTYSTPPAVFVLPSGENFEPTQLRIVNVTTTGFDVQQFEPSGEDGLTPAAEISYLAATPGTHSLPSGELVEVGFVDITEHQGRGVPGPAWFDLLLDNNFPDTAVLLLEIQTSNNGTLIPGEIAVPALDVAARNIDTNSAQIALEYAETTAGTISTPERVAYLAMADNTTANFLDATGASRSLQAIRSADSIFGFATSCHLVNFGTTFTDPVAIASSATRDGGDGGWIRRCSLGATSVGLGFDEDQAADPERDHTSEAASVVVLDEPFDGPLGSGGWEADHVSLPAIASSVFGLAFTNVVFPRPLRATPVVLTQPTAIGGGDPVAIRIRNVTPNGFQIAAVHPPGTSAASPSMVLDYIAVVPGQHQLRDGTEFEAGFVDSIQTLTGANIGGPQGSTTVNFAQTYSQPPTVLAHLQTINNGPSNPDPALPFVPWLTTAVMNLASTSVAVSLERSEVDDGTITTSERIGYLAFPANRHATLEDIAGSSVAYDSRLATNAVTGAGNTCTAVNYTSSFSSVPLAVGHSATRNGDNGGWARRCGISATALSQEIDEDQDNDTERFHIQESISQLAFAQAFEWAPPTNVSLTSSIEVVSDGFSTTQFKALPGAEVDTLVRAVNDGAGVLDTTSTSMVFAIDSNTELFVGDLDGAGHSVVFIDGVAPAQSGLIWLPAQHISYSNNNAASFTYAPAATLDFDPAVTHLRIAPTGTFVGAIGNTTPEFTVRYRVRIR